MCIACWVCRSSLASFFSMSRFKSQFGLFGAMLNKSCNKRIKYSMLCVIGLNELNLEPASLRLLRQYFRQDLQRSFLRCLCLRLAHFVSSKCAFRGQNFVMRERVRDLRCCIETMSRCKDRYMKSVRFACSSLAQSNQPSFTCFRRF